MRTPFCALILAVFCLPSLAQSSQKIEIFGGFSYLNYEAASVKMPSGTETITFTCPSNPGTSGTCNQTEVGPTYVNFNPRMGLYGWNASVTAILTPRFGITTDFSGNYSTATRSETTTLTVTQINQPCVLGPCSNTTTDTYQYAVSEPLLHHFLFGPQFTFPAGKVKAYGHFLVGGERRNVTSGQTVGLGISIPAAVGALVSSSSSTNLFAMGFGGGADYPLRKKLAWRTGVDYLTSTGTAQNHVRVSTGLVWQVGK